MSARPRIAFLTGQSDPGRCALSPQQHAFLRGLGLPETIECVARNFPWQTDTRPWRPVPLPRASLANLRQYLAACRGDFAHLSPELVRKVRDDLRHGPRTVLLVGSCGLSLLDALLAQWPADAAQRAHLRVVAFGAVGPRWPSGIDGRQLRGRRDWVAACAAPREGPPPIRIDCGHLDYLAHPALRDLVLQQIDWLLQGAQTQRRSPATGNDPGRIGGGQP